jgi:hypothetical protein
MASRPNAISGPRIERPAAWPAELVDADFGDEQVAFAALTPDLQLATCHLDLVGGPYASSLLCPKGDPHGGVVAVDCQFSPSGKAFLDVAWVARR